jgi:hypothetical protein
VSVGSIEREGVYGIGFDGKIRKADQSVSSIEPFYSSVNCGRISRPAEVMDGLNSIGWRWLGVWRALAGAR